MMLQKVAVWTLKLHGKLYIRDQSIMLVFLGIRTS